MNIDEVWQARQRIEDRIHHLTKTINRVDSTSDSNAFERTMEAIELKNLLEAKKLI